MIAFSAWPHDISQYGYIALFLLSLVEGPVVTLFAGFLASQGVFSVAGVYATVVLGDLAGDIIYYAIGRWFIGRLPWRFGRYNETLRRHIDTVRTQIRARPGRILIFGKLTHSAGFAILLAAGGARLRPAAFILYNLLGTLPKSAVLVAAGYFFGHFYKTLDSYGQLIGLIGFLIVSIVVMYWFHRLDMTCSDPKGSK